MRNSTQLWLESRKRRSKRRRDDNINIDLLEIELVGVYWTYLAEDRVHCKAVLNRLVP